MDCTLLVNWTLSGSLFADFGLGLLTVAGNTCEHCLWHTLVRAHTYTRREHPMIIIMMPECSYCRRLHWLYGCRNLLATRPWRSCPDSVICCQMLFWRVYSILSTCIIKLDFAFYINRLLSGFVNNLVFLELCLLINVLCDLYIMMCVLNIFKLATRNFDLL